MRYIYDRLQTEPRPNPERQPARYAAALRRDLSARNLLWARQNRAVHEITLGGSPAVLYREDEQGCHGNFYPASYAEIRQNPGWFARLNKRHSTARRVLLSRDPDRSELDSSHSSDALLMSLFCHPQAFRQDSPLRRLLGIESAANLLFGYRPHIPLRNKRGDSTEIDLRAGNLLIEAKLTEYDFQTAPWRLVERYRDLDEVFETDALPRCGTSMLSYQLIRGVLAAQAEPGARFCVLLDARRPDLVESWYRILRCVRSPELRCRLALLSWQELAPVCPGALQRWLGEKYGIGAAVATQSPEDSAFAS